MGGRRVAAEAHGGEPVGDLGSADPGDEVDAGEGAAGAQVGDQATRPVHPGAGVGLDGGDELVGHGQLGKAGRQAAGHRRAGHDEDGGKDVAVEVDRVPPPEEVLDSTTTPGRTAGRRRASTPAARSRRAVTATRSLGEHVAALGHHRAHGEPGRSVTDVGLVAVDEQEVVDVVPGGGEQVPAEAEQVAVAGVEAGGGSPPARCTSRATARLDTAARPVGLSGTRNRLVTAEPDGDPLGDGAAVRTGHRLQLPHHLERGRHRSASSSARTWTARGDQVLQRGADLGPAAGLEAAVGVHPQLVGVDDRERARGGARRWRRCSAPAASGCPRRRARRRRGSGARRGARACPSRCGPPPARSRRRRARRRRRGCRRTRRSTCGCGSGSGPGTPAVARRKHSVAQSRYALWSVRRSGRPSRSAGSSTWITPMPASSRSATSSRTARAIWRHVSARGWSSRTNDHCRIVTGPVSIPLTGRSVSDWA